MRGWKTASWVVAFFAIAFTATVPGYISRYHIPIHSAVGIYVCFLLMLVMVVVPAIRSIRLLPLLWPLPYLAYAAGTGDFKWLALARLIAVAASLPPIYRFFPVRDLRRFAWQDLLVALWLITVVLSNQLNGIWTVPANLDFMGRLYLIGIASWTWTSLRPVPNLGYEFVFSLKTFQAAAVNFWLFAIIAIPSGLALHFIDWNPKWHGLGAVCADYLAGC